MIWKITATSKSLVRNYQYPTSQPWRIGWVGLEPFLMQEICQCSSQYTLSVTPAQCTWTLNIRNYGPPVVWPMAMTEVPITWALEEKYFRNNCKFKILIENTGSHKITIHDLQKETWAVHIGRKPDSSRIEQSDLIPFWAASRGLK